MKYIDLDFVKPNKDCTQGCDNITDNAYVCFECEDIQIKEKYPNAIYNDDCEWVINDQLKFLLLSHGFIFNDSINNNNITREINDKNNFR